MKRIRENAVRNILLAGVLIGFVGACSTVANIGAGIGQATGAIDERQAASIRRTGERAEASFEDFTPEQEYFIGRSVAATVLESYPEYENEEVNEYVDLVGQTLALFSDRPSIFGGYSFQLLDDEEINAFATPGGHIFISVGMVRLAENEDQLAAVLAHEIQHVVESHGLQAIRTSRVTGALTSAALTGVQLATSEDVAELTEIFEDSIDDITQTLFTAGYSRGAEREADLGAVAIMRRAGYAPGALYDFLGHLDSQWEQDGPGLAQTHPSPQDRMEDVREALEDDDPGVDPRRTERFQQILGNL